jgi:L-malate glycosyltransferase
MMKRLLIISTMKGFRWGGSEELWYAAAMHALRKGVHVEVVVFGNLPLHEKLIQLQEQGAVLHVVGEREVLLPPLRKRALYKLTKRSYTVKYTNRFQFIRSIQADCILLNQGDSADLLYYEDLQQLFANIQTPYAVLNQHNFEYRKFTAAQQQTLSNIFKKATHVFFVANRNREVAERQLATAIPNAVLLKNPVNLSGNKEIEWPSATVPAFAVVARLDVDYKGQDILLQTLAADKWKQRLLRVSLFGTGPDEAYIKKLISFYKLEQTVFLKGHTSNIEEVWQQHHVLILPSHSEGTPLSLVEAMLCGRPCVVTDVGDNAVLVQDNATGWVAYTSSLKALDEALERAWQQQPQWKAMGAAAHTSVSGFVDLHPGATLFEKISNG